MHLVFHLLLLKRDITRKKTIDQKITGKLKFEKTKQPKQEVDIIIDSIVFTKKAIDGKLPELYYFIHWKGEIHAEDT